MMLVDVPGFGFMSREKDMVLLGQYLTQRPELRLACLLINAGHGVKDIDRYFVDLLEDGNVPYQVVYRKGDERKKKGEKEKAVKGKEDGNSRKWKENAAQGGIERKKAMNKKNKRNKWNKKNKQEEEEEEEEEEETNIDVGDNSDDNCGVEEEEEARERIKQSHSNQFLIPADIPHKVRSYQ